MRRNNTCPHCLRRFSMLALVRLVLVEHYVLSQEPMKIALIKALVNLRVVSDGHMVNNALQVLVKMGLIKRWRRGYYSANEGVSANDNQLVTKLHVRKLSGTNQAGT